MSRDDTLAFWITAAGCGELRSEPVPTPRSDEASVRTLFSGVSRGTEALVFGGHVPISEYERMRAPFQSGDFPAPVKYGYCSVGEVTQGPPGWMGKSVFCLYPHQERYVVPCTALYMLPKDVPAARAVLAANIETALNGLWDSGAGPGDRIVVIGGGSVGCLAAWLAARIPGTDVQLIDINAHRAGIAQRLGVRFGLPADAMVDADVVLHTSGTAQGLQLAVACAGFEATIIELSWYGDRSVAVALGGAFHARRLTLRSSQVGSIGQEHRARWTLRRRMELALSLLTEPALDALINSEGPFAQLPRTLEQLSSDPGDVIMHRVTYS